MWALKLHILGQIIIQLSTMPIIEPSNVKSRQHNAEQLKHNGQYDYLNQKQPLWVLEDEVQSTERDTDRLTFTTTERPIYSKYYFKYRRNKMLPAIGYHRKSAKPSPKKTIQNLYLPKNYVYPERETNKYVSLKPTLRRRHQPVRIPIAQDNVTPSMPTFDSVPTDMNDEMIAPIFVYNGPKGELIMNTMLSAHKYPMQEPVPGEILYPPTEPIFRPKPIVQSFRMASNTEPFNLTLIPFYAHEAIFPRFMFDSYSKASTAATSLEAVEKTTAKAATAVATHSPAVLYAAATAPTPPLTTSTTSTTPYPNPYSKSFSKKRRNKKAKKYAVYRSADEVHWRPTEPSKASERVSTVTTSFPMVLASPPQNHRFNLIDDGNYGYDITATAPLSSSTTTTTSTPNPMNNFKLTYTDEGSQFQIVYVDESLEKPSSQQIEPTKPAITRQHRLSTPKPLPLLSSHYSSDKEYFAFPVYTLGKLLKPDIDERTFTQTSHPAIDRKQKPENFKDSDTWFIMNSRYKGQHSINGPKKLSSKYVEIGPAYGMQSVEDIAETTVEKAII